MSDCVELSALMHGGCLGCDLDPDACRGTANEASLMDDCTDRSVNILATLRPLERASKRLSSVRRSPSNQGLDSVEY